MGPAIGFHTLTKRDIVSGNKKCSHQIALQISDRVCHAIEQALYLLEILSCELFIVHQVDTDEHQGRKLGTEGFAVELDAGIVEEEAKMTCVGLAECDSTMLPMTVAEQLYQRGLEVGNDVISEQAASIIVKQLDMADIDARNGNLELVIEHVERNREREVSLTLTNFGDDSLASCHWPVYNQHLVSLAHFCSSGDTLTYLEVQLADGIAEKVHLLVRDMDNSTLSVAESPNWRLQRLVPRTAEECVDKRLLAINEHEVVEVTAEGCTVELGLVLAVTVESGFWTFQRWPEPDVAERYIIIERRQGQFLLLVGERHLFPFGKDVVHHRGVRVSEDIPSPSITCRFTFLNHIYGLICPRNPGRGTFTHSSSRAAPLHRSVYPLRFPL